MPPVVNIRNLASGEVRALPEADALGVVASQPATWALETTEQAAEATRTAQVRRDYDTLGDKAAGGLAAFNRGATIGLSDVGARALGADPAEMANQRAALGGWAAPLEIAGAVAPALLTGGASAPESAGALARGLASVTPAGAASRLGAALTRAGEGVSLAARVGRGALGAGTEGALYGAGQVASESALSDDPLTLDHLKGAVTSNFLLTGALGATSSALEHALAGGSRHFDRLKREAEAAPTVADDLATLDRKGLDTVHEAELARIEASRVPERAQLGADVAALRDQLQAQKPWVAVAQGGTLAEKEAAIKLAKKTKAAAQKAEERAAPAEARALAAESAASHPVVEGVAETAASPTPRQSWKEFQASRMGEYMKSEGGHGPAMKRIGEEWKVYKAAEPAGATSATARVTGVDAADARAAATAAREAADAALTEAAAVEARANALRAKAPPWMGKGSAVTAKSDMTLDRILDDPKAIAGLAGNEQFRSKALSVQTALRKAETHYENILAHEAELKAMYVHDTNGLAGTRATAFAAIPDALAKNRALQQRIDALIAAPASPRLGAIKDAITSYADRAKLTTAQKIGGAIAGGTAMSAVYAVGGAIPGVGFLAPLAGAAAAGAAIGKLGRVLGKTSIASLERSKRAVDALMSGVKTLRRVTPPLASKVLAAFAGPDESPTRRRAAPTIQDHYERAAAKVMALVQPDPVTGTSKVRAIVRASMAKRLAPITSHDPRLADQMETAAVKHIEFLADKMPRVTQLGATRLMPSEAAIRGWARMVAAVDDPGAIEERVAHGTVTPEDREVMQALYPERLAAFTRQIIEHPESVAKLPYQRRLALALFTGAPVEASLEPRILAALQGIYAREPGTAGGTQAPRPQPAFGSVKAPEATPAERRAG